jgi:cellulose synthase/poly-beta-1,6-N-acetylglucosamine synthase-like glycosyltransferase
LTSVGHQGHVVVYVDSGSTDDSPALARRLGAVALELDTSRPFTAARARNVGFEYLTRHCPEVEFVQFVDADCEVADDWLQRAERELKLNPRLAAVCGRRRERHPHSSLYNRLCDLEWDGPPGEATSFGGDVMIRASALREAGGYNPSIIAAEDTELAVRLRLAGWHISRLDADMTRHDAAMTRLDQWWRRSIRAGHGFAENCALHGHGPLRHYLHESRRIWFWGFLLPIVALAFAWVTHGLTLLLLTAYVFAYRRALQAARSRSWSENDARLYARYCTWGKFPEALGQLVYWRNRLLGQSSRIIEYKAAAAYARRWPRATTSATKQLAS